LSERGGSVSPEEAALEDVDIGGLRIAFERAGHGPPLLLLHGAVCDSRTWRDQLDDLADEFTVVAWDAPGCGQSSDPPESFRMPEFAACVVGLVDQLGLDRPHVLGHSWGSSLALEVYRLDPTGVRSLVLVGAYAGWAGSLPAEEVERRLAFALEAANPDAGSFEPTTMPGLFSDVMPPDRAAELAAIMSEIRPAGTRTMAHALAEADLRPLLPTIDVPVLVLAGDDDQRSPLPVAQALHDATPTSILEVMPGLGHMCFVEDGGSFNAAVRRFLATVGDRSVVVAQDHGAPEAGQA
jgi:pimeloyl-ACP methyl ester carboxylesterase